ncbi:MAG: CRISPR-associated endonuclease Cas1 [Promethearchaeota archaeon]
MDVILETPGTYVRKRKEMIKIAVPEKKAVEVPIREIESIIMGDGVQITSQTLKMLSSYAITIVFTSLGKPYGIYTPFANQGTVFTRRQQLMAYHDWRGCHLALQFVYAAIENKRKLLLYFAKNRKKTKPNKYYILRAAARQLDRMKKTLVLFSKTQAKGKTIQDIRMELMGIEGKAAAIYFRNYGITLPKEFKTYQRTRRPPRDPINSLLSLGYTILQGHIHTAIAAAGLELYGGFLHSDRSGKPSLALDLLEEFRQPIIDRLVMRLSQQRRIKKEDFKSSIYGFHLKDDKKVFYYQSLRREILGKDTSQLLFDDNLSEEGAGSAAKGPIRINFKREMIAQARKIANYLIGATSCYEPFIMKW